MKVFHQTVGEHHGCPQDNRAPLAAAADAEMLEHPLLPRPAFADDRFTVGPADPVLDVAVQPSLFRATQPVPLAIRVGNVGPHLRFLSLWLQYAVAVVSFFHRGRTVRTMSVATKCCRRYLAFPGFVRNGPREQGGTFVCLLGR
jgi:hypothetical protein